MVSAFRNAKVLLINMKVNGHLEYYIYMNS